MHRLRPMSSRSTDRSLAATFSSCRAISRRGFSRWLVHAKRVVGNVTAFDDSGPLFGKPSSEAQVQALSGILDTTAHPTSIAAFLRVQALRSVTVLTRPTSITAA